MNIKMIDLDEAAFVRIARLPKHVGDEAAFVVLVNEDGQAVSTLTTTHAAAMGIVEHFLKTGEPKPMEPMQ